MQMKSKPSVNAKLISRNRVLLTN